MLAGNNIDAGATDCRDPTNKLASQLGANTPGQARYRPLISVPQSKRFYPQLPSPSQLVNWPASKDKRDELDGQLDWRR